MINCRVNFNIHNSMCAGIAIKFVQENSETVSIRFYNKVLVMYGLANLIS